MSLKTMGFMTNNNLVIISHPPYSPDIAPCDFASFLNWKWNWRDDVLKQCQTSKGNCEQYSTALRKMTSTVLLKGGKTMGSVHKFPRKLFWRRWQPKLSKLSKHFFFDLVWELSDSSLYSNNGCKGTSFPEELNSHEDLENTAFYVILCSELHKTFGKHTLILHAPWQCSKYVWKFWKTSACV
jgi:hypothetical protein